MNYRASGSNGGGRVKGGEGGGQAISTHLACRPPADRGIPGASLDWQPRASYNALFSRRSVSVKRRRLLHASPGLSSRVLTCPRDRVIRCHVRILAIEPTAFRRFRVEKKTHLFADARARLFGRIRIS